MIMITIMLLPLFIFAGSEKKSDDGTKSFTAMLALLKYEEDGRQQIYDEFKKFTGVEMNNLLAEGTIEKVKIALASGEIPGLINARAEIYPNLVSDGILIDLAPMLKKSKILQTVPKDLLDVFKSADGKIYAVPYQHGGGCVGYFRQDWLDKLGLKVPATWAELVEVMRAFTFNDPDGDGKQNTYGYTTLVNDDFDNYSRLLMQDAYMDIQYFDGEWIDGFSQPEIAGAMKRFKYLYDEKLVDPQVITAKSTSEARSKLIEGKVGIFEYWAGEWGMNLDEYAKAANPAAVIASMPAIKETRYKNRIPPAFGITTAAEDPQLIFDSFIEGLLDKGKCQILWTYGVEEVHWTKKNGTPEFLPLLTDNTRLFKKSLIARELQLNDMPLMIDFDPRVMDSMADFKKYEMTQDAVPPNSELYAKNMGDLRNLKKETILKIITGEYATIEEGIAVYKERAEKEMKLTAILKEMNELMQ